MYTPIFLHTIAIENKKEAKFMEKKNCRVLLFVKHAEHMA